MERARPSPLHVVGLVCDSLPKMPAERFSIFSSLNGSQSQPMPKNFDRLFMTLFLCEFLFFCFVFPHLLCWHRFCLGSALCVEDIMCQRFGRHQWTITVFPLRPFLSCRKKTKKGGKTCPLNGFIQRQKLQRIESSIRSPPPRLYNRNTCADGDAVKIRGQNENEDNLIQRRPVEFPSSPPTNLVATCVPASKRTSNAIQSSWFFFSLPHKSLLVGQARK